ncbi:extracellular solute-binding protein [Paenibacillus thalictri]|nr:extracellular solute-binding protein [Paenibacillus thalictri]
MKKKLVSIPALFSAVLLVSTLSGCGGAEPAKTDNAAAAGQPAQKTAPSEPSASSQIKPAKITWWAAWAEDQGPAEMIKKFNQKYPQIKVEYVQFTNSDEGNVKVDTSLVAGQQIDVFFNYGLPRLEARAKKGVLQDLNEFLTKDKVDVAGEFGQETFQIDGKYYGLPATSLIDAVFINKKMLDAAGLKVPERWTLDEYAEYAKALTKGEGSSKIYGSSDYLSNYYWTNPVRGLLGSNAWYKSDGTSNFDHPAYKKALEFKNKIENVDKYQYPYTEYKSTKSSTNELFIQGKMAMAVNSNSVARFISNTKDYPRDFLVTVAPLPTLEKDQKEVYTNGLRHFGYLAMNKNTKEKEASWLFLKWLSTEGSVDLAQVGHIPTWKKNNKDAIAAIMLGPNADKVVDVETFKRVILNYDAKSYTDTIYTAYNEVNKILQDEAEKALFGISSIDDALKEMKKKADQAIKAAK